MDDFIIHADTGCAREAIRPLRGRIRASSREYRRSHCVELRGSHSDSNRRAHLLDREGDDPANVLHAFKIAG